VRLRMAWSFMVLAGVVLMVGCASTGAKKQVEAEGLPPEIRADDPLAPTMLMQQGETLVQEGKVAEGIAKYKLALNIQPENPTIFNLMGLAELRRGNASKAVEWFNGALLRAPTYSDARNNRGAAYARLGQLSLAEEDYLQVLGDHEYANRAGVFFNLGSLYLAKGNLAAAEENLRKAAVPAGPVEAFVLLGEVEQRLHKLDAAEAVLREGLARAPERVDLSLALAFVLERQGRKDEAQKLFEKVVSLAPTSPEAAQARLHLGR
jgi:type IV pilus assembly protein PilF